MTKRGMLKDWRKYCAEFLGTMVLAVVGMGAVVLPISMIATGNGNGGFGLENIMGVLGAIFAPFAFGFALTAVVFIIGPISGAHVNPALSLGLALRRKLGWKDCIFYIIAQLIGAIAGVVILFGVFKLLAGGGAAFTFAETFANKGGAYVNGMFGVMIIEIVMTFVFVLAWMGIVRKVENKVAAGFAIGLILTAVVLAGATVNPAINLANAVFGGVDALKDVWLFLVAPLIGGLLAALVACCLFKNEDREQVGTKNAPKLSDVEPVKSKSTAK